MNYLKVCVKEQESLKKINIMCLVCDNLKFKTAEEDIECYKVVIKIDENSYITPYQRFLCSLNEHYINKHEIDNYQENKNTYYVYGGVYHSFQKLSDAYFEMLWFQTINNCPPQYDMGKKSVVVKCIIPKGTEYIEGNFNNLNYCPCYGSKEIIYKEELNREQYTSLHLMKETHPIRVRFSFLQSVSLYPFLSCQDCQLCLCEFYSLFFCQR